MKKKFHPAYMAEIWFWKGAHSGFLVQPVAEVSLQLRKVKDVYFMKKAGHKTLQQLLTAGGHKLRCNAQTPTKSGFVAY